MLPATQPDAVQTRQWAVIRYLILDKAPYLSRIVLSLRLYIPPVPDVTHISDNCCIYISPELLAGDPNEMRAWVEHAVWHVLRKHSRLNRLPIPEIGALCGCIEINDDLPPVGPSPHDFNLPTGLLAEEYYRLLDIPPPDQTCGSGAGADADEWETDDLPPDMETIAVVVAQAITEHARQNPGDVPAGMTVWADGIITPPTIPWDVQLGNIVGAYATSVKGRDDWSYRLPSRRQREDVIMPGMITHTPRVGVVVDTSGSMGEQQLAAAMAEVGGVIDASGVDVLFVSCDCDTTTPVEVGVGGLSSVRLIGGGGTDMTAGIASVLSVQACPVDVVVVVTDGDTPWPNVDPGVPVVVCLVAGEREIPGWATKVTVT